MNRMMEGPIQSTLHFQDHDGVLYHHTMQPTEGLILERNKRIRNNPGIIRDLGSDEGKDNTWGRMVAQVPFIHMAWAQRNGFDLMNKDGHIAGREMHRFLTTTDRGRACLLSDHY